MEWELPVVMLGLWAAQRWAAQPRPCGQHQRRLLDVGDGWLRATMVVLFLVWCGFLAHGLWADDGPRWRHHRDQLDAVMLGFALLSVAWWQRRVFIELRLARPSTLTVSPWPLRVGEPVTLTFERTLRPGVEPGPLKARLVRLGAPKKGSKTPAQLDRRVLEAEETSFRQSRVRAIWRLEAPGPPGDPLPSELSRVGEVLQDVITRERWVLEVQLPVKTGALLDASFELPIEAEAPAP